MEQQKYCSGIFLDFALAFDKVWHDGLLHNLQINFPPPYYLLFKSYLDQRSFLVNINNSISNQYKINTGVPQSSNLSPLLFLISTFYTPTFTFADDTYILTLNDASFKLQHHLNLLEIWFTNWKIKINTANRRISNFLFTQIPAHLSKFSTQQFPKLTKS